MNEIELNNALKYAEMQLTLSTNESKTRFFKTIVSALRAELPRQESAPLTCEGCKVIKFARVGEKSDKLFSAHIFPEENMFTVEARAYNGDGRPMAGDAIPRAEYENYDPFLVFEFYQKDSVIALRDTCNWIIDTLDERAKEEPACTQD